MTATPSIVYPVTDWVSGSEYKTDNFVQTIGGIVNVSSADVSSGTVIVTIQMRYKIKRGGVEGSYSSFSDAGITVGATITGVDALPWYFNSRGVVGAQVGDRITYQFKTVERRSVNNTAGYVISESSAVSIVAEIVSEEQIQETVSYPTGVRVQRAQEYIKILVPESAIVLNNTTEFVGANFYVSLTAGGGADGYQIMNDMYVTSTDDSEEEITTLVETERTEEASEVTVHTVASRQTTNNFYTFTVNLNIISDLVAEGKIENIFLSDGTTIDPNTRFYFVTTFVGYDESLSQVIESAYSIELEASFLQYSTDFKALPARTRSDILFSVTRRVVANNSKANVISGSVIRDMIDPVALEFEKFYLIQDFIFVAMSVDTLIQFDDSDGDGISDPLVDNLPKRRLADALNIADEVTFQFFIDEQFDRLGSNFNLTRNEAVRAKGLVVFYTETQPSNDILIPAGTIVSTPANTVEGIPSQSFVVVSTRIMDADNIGYYYNASKDRYEVEAVIEAQTPGSRGNVAAGSIDQADGLNPLIQVENTVPTDLGENRESNRRFSDRIKLAQIAFDSGTEGGYAATTLKVPGILQARVEKVGDPLMIRDFDELRGEHVGGKIDVYIKGERFLQTVDQIAFKYEYPTNTLGDKVGEVFSILNPNEFRLRCQNQKVSSKTPIVSVTLVRNVTRGENYSLEGLQIVGNGDVIVLAKNQTNNAIGMATFDVIEVSYRYRSSNVLVLSSQPVKEIISITDSNETLIDASQYRLIKKGDPLKEGYSNIAEDGVEFLFISGSQFDEFVDVEDEAHDMYINIPTPLNLKGVIESTIVVSDPDDSTVIYIKDVDYTVSLGSEIESTTLSLTLNSKIRQGDRVAVDYRAAQNFNVTYVHNSLVDQVQDKLEEMKHAAADVITKEAIGNSIDLSFRVIRKTGVELNTLKTRIQTAVANYVSRLTMGEYLTQGALINIVKSVEGVKEIQMPLLKMMKRNGSFLPLEEVGKVSFQVYQRTSSQGVTSYITLESVLSQGTSENGGPSNFFRGIYEDGIPLLLVDHPEEVALGSGRGYIQGDGKLIVSTSNGAPPQTKEYAVSYFIDYPSGTSIVEDIEASQIEYLKVDSLSLRDIEILDERVVKRGL